VFTNVCEEFAASVFRTEVKPKASYNPFILGADFILWNQHLELNVPYSVYRHHHCGSWLFCKDKFIMKLLFEKKK
jgi:hypothetical protein